METEEARIMQIETELVRAFLNRDIKALERILAETIVIAADNRDWRSHGSR